MDMNVDLDLDLDLDPLGPGDTDFSFFEPLADDEASAGQSSHHGPLASRPYHSKAGSTSFRSPGSTRGRTPPASTVNDSTALVVAEPMFRPVGMSDANDMKMLWFYTAETYHSFNVEGGRTGSVDHVLRVRIPELAFRSPFLMQTLMGLSALNLKTLNQEVDDQKAVAYRAKAFEGYRNAIEAGREEDYPALLAGSLLICALSSEMFREADTKPLYIIDWMVVWRGIGLIVEMVSPATIANYGLAVLFYRPPIDLEKSTRHIPNNLLFMVQSIGPDDADYEHQQTYYTMLRYLGSLYQELENGFSPIMDLRVITFFTFIPREFIPLAKEHRPRALVILAHYCAFTKQNRGPWWMWRIGSRQIQEISDAVGDAWEHLMRVPRKVMYLEDRTEIAKTILQNATWTPPDQDLYAPETRDPRCKTLQMVTDEGAVARIVDGEWELDPPPLFVNRMRLGDPDADLEPDKLLGEQGQPIDLDSPISNSRSSSTLSPAPSSVMTSGSSNRASSPDAISS
ncbi:hypothetical protein JX265_010733 [Neoarthrinium moseri]|uniref:Uncharacterized protein n=1 Tax=Neoarthrinium moseri TaxID=1658444 RepID=A0A9P9WE16_9PEZI|nr:hypothetical protein JX265_010733 [Neoarthrinium moseri]